MITLHSVYVMVDLVVIATSCISMHAIILRFALYTERLLRCNRALTTIQAASGQCSTNIGTMRDNIVSIRRRHRGLRESKFKKLPSWKHRFVCLAYREQSKLPTSEVERNKLLEANLGEKEIQFENVHSTPNEFREKIYEAFPQLQDAGGYQFLKCAMNSKNLELLSPVVFSSPAILKQRVGVARTYIRPLQRDLDLTPMAEIPDRVFYSICSRNF